MSDMMWSVVMWSEVTWCMWSDFVLKWSAGKWSYFEDLRDKINMHIRVTLYWGYLIVLWLFDFSRISCIVVVLTCFVMCECVCVCVCVDCVMCGCVYVWVVWQLCACFSNKCNCIYCVLCSFVYLYIYSCFFTSVRTTATEWKLNCSK